MQYKWVISIPHCWMFSVKTHLYCMNSSVQHLTFSTLTWSMPFDFSSMQLFVVWFQVDNHFFRCPNDGWGQCRNIIKQISQSSSCSINGSFLFQINCWIFFVQIHLYYIWPFSTWPYQRCLTFQLCNFSMFHFRLITISVKVFQYG